MGQLVYFLLFVRKTNFMNHLYILRSASEDDESDGESVVPTHRSQRASQRSPRKNGRTKIDMTPPDKKLKNAEKKVVRFTENGKVGIFSKVEIKNIDLSLQR